MSDRFKEIRVQYDEHTMFLGRVARLPSGKLEYDAFRVLCFIGAVQYDITNGFSDEQRGHFMSAYELEIEMKFMDKLHDVADAIVHDFDLPEGAA